VRKRHYLHINLHSLQLGEYNLFYMSVLASDAADLKSADRKVVGFKSPSGHHKINFLQTDELQKGYPGCPLRPALGAEASRHAKPSWSLFSIACITATAKIDSQDGVSRRWKGCRSFWEM